MSGNYTGPLQPGWLSIQWVKINNLTATLGSPYYTDAETLASGGGFGLRSVCPAAAILAVCPTFQDQRFNPLKSMTCSASVLFVCLVQVYVGKSKHPTKSELLQAMVYFGLKCGISLSINES